MRTLALAMSVAAVVSATIAMVADVWVCLRRKRRQEDFDVRECAAEDRIRRNLREWRKRAPLKQVELVDELERLVERHWGDGYVEAAPLSAAFEVYALAASVCRVPAMARDGEHKAELTAYVAGGAGDCRRRVVCIGDAFDADEHARGEMDAAEALADVEPGRLVGEAALVCVAFRAEFVSLALDVCQPRVDGDEVVFECRDPLAAKERAKALKRLAARVDEFEDVNDVSNAHALIIAYFGERRALNLNNERVCATRQTISDCAAALPHAVSRVSTSRLTAGKDRH